MCRTPTTGASGPSTVATPRRLPEGRRPRAGGRRGRPRGGAGGTSLTGSCRRSPPPSPRGAARGTAARQLPVRCQAPSPTPSAPAPHGGGFPVWKRATSMGAAASAPGIVRDARVASAMPTSVSALPPCPFPGKPGCVPWSQDARRVRILPLRRRERRCLASLRFPGASHGPAGRRHAERTPSVRTRESLVLPSPRRS